MLNQIVYISSKSLQSETAKLSAISNRTKVVDELIASYGLLDKCYTVNPPKCSSSDLLIFHSSDYVECLKRSNQNQVDDLNEVTEELEEFGIAYDCPLIERIYDFVTQVAGSTVAAVDAVLNGAKFAINWSGGWHHAQRDKAAGFCYVNDIVIGISKLRSKFQKVLYIDLDVHHGDGVENAFCSSKYVMTVSTHLHEAGYFPGTGNVTDIGIGAGRGYTVNAPYDRDISGEMFVPYFTEIAQAVYETFRPNVCVIQCGGDVISGDHLGGTNLLPGDCISCVKKILEFKVPFIFLGGGGYNIINTAKYWTALTATILNVEISKDIPENDFFLDFGPDYVIDVCKRNVKDKNNAQDLSQKVCVIKGNNQISKLKLVELSLNALFIFLF
uniref:Histone deacetylase n=2 Tax=Culex pipiens TaxID=7175 RepID=A0A8D8GRB9_CULPI